jgi:uncharacterized membrane protein YhaH (DUF805 family)
MDTYLDGWLRFSDFTGRSRASEYWGFVFGNVAILFALVLLLRILAELVPESEELLGLLVVLFLLAAAVPTLAAAVRRLHDTGRSGWLLLIALIPFAGLVLLVFLLTAGDAGENRYGPARQTKTTVSVPRHKDD